MSNKAIIIAVSLFITIMISSTVLFTINQVKEVYAQVYETDTLIQNNFDEFDAYDNSQKTQLELLNTAKKYENSTSVFVTNISQGNIGSSIEEKKQKAKDNKINVKDLQSSLIEEDTQTGKAIIKDQTSANALYNTYIERLDDGSVIIGFVAQ